MELSELSANIRTTIGNGPARQLRCKGNMPAILYGPGTEPLPLSVNILDFERSLKKSNAKMKQTVFNLNIPNSEKSPRSAMVKELQRHPLSGAFLHVDFYEIAMDRKVKVKVPVTTKGIAKGLDLGGMLQLIRREIDVCCFPNEIPNAIEVDVTEMNVGDAIHVKDLKTEGNIQILSDADYTVLTLLGKKAEKEAVAAEAVEEEPAAEAAAAPKAKAESGKPAKSK